MLYSITNKILKNILYLIFFFDVIFTQVRIGESKSITSTLNIKSLAIFEDKIFLATKGGLVRHDIEYNKFQIFTKDHGLIDTDIKSLHLDKNNFLWIGSDQGIQVWEIASNSLHSYFDLKIEKVVGFTNYEETVYAAIKRDGIWGIMEFIYTNEKMYYRDFYEINNLPSIKDIMTFGSRIILNGDDDLIAGNPSFSHPKFWEDPYPDLIDNIKSVYVRDTSMVIQTDNKLLATSFSNMIDTLLIDDDLVYKIKDIIIDDDKNSLIGITESSIFSLNNSIFSDDYIDSSFNFNKIIIDESKIWIGTEIGLVSFKSSQLTHHTFNQPIVSSPEVINFTSEGKLVLASTEGISISEWINLSKFKSSQNLSKELNSINLYQDLGSQISSIVNIEKRIFLGLINSSYAGVLSLNVDSPIESFKAFRSDSKEINGKFLYNTTDMAVDKNNNIWLTDHNTTKSIITVFNDNQFRYITKENSNNILKNGSRAIAIDNFNRVWIAMPNSLAMYSYSADPFQPPVEDWIEEPIFLGLNRQPFDINISEKNRLWILTNYGLIYKDLRVSNSEPVTVTGPKKSNGDLSPYLTNIPFDEYSKIKFDPRGNIWISTQNNGIFILDENGIFWPSVDGLNSSNSNLLSNHVNDIDFDPLKGLAYIATSKGVTSLKIPFSTRKKSFDSIEIFPSPFSIPSDKRMTIDGLKDNSQIIIMTVNGKGIKSILDENIIGYQAFWDGTNDNNELVRTGIYLVMIYNKNGDSTFEKIAVIRK